MQNTIEKTQKINYCKVVPHKSENDDKVVNSVFENIPNNENQNTNNNENKVQINITQKEAFNRINAVLANKLTNDEIEKLLKELGIVETKAKTYKLEDINCLIESIENVISNYTIRRAGYEVKKAYNYVKNLICGDDEAKGESNILINSIKAAYISAKESNLKKEVREYTGESKLAQMWKNLWSKDMLKELGLTPEQAENKEILNQKIEEYLKSKDLIINETDSIEVKNQKYDKIKKVLARFIEKTSLENKAHVVNFVTQVCAVDRDKALELIESSCLGNVEQISKTQLAVVKNYPELTATDKKGDVVNKDTQVKWSENAFSKMKDEDLKSATEYMNNETKNYIFDKEKYEKCKLIAEEARKKLNNGLALTEEEKLALEYVDKYNSLVNENSGAIVGFAMNNIAEDENIVKDCAKKTMNQVEESGIQEDVTATAGAYVSKHQEELGTTINDFVNKINELTDKQNTEAVEAIKKSATAQTSEETAQTAGQPENQTSSTTVPFGINKSSNTADQNTATHIYKNDDKPTSLQTNPQEKQAAKIPTSCQDIPTITFTGSNADSLGFNPRITGENVGTLYKEGISIADILKNGDPKARDFALGIFKKLKPEDQAGIIKTCSGDYSTTKDLLTNASLDAFKNLDMHFANAALNKMLKDKRNELEEKQKTC